MSFTFGSFSENSTAGPTAKAVPTRKAVRSNAKRRIAHILPPDALDFKVGESYLKSYHMPSDELPHVPSSVRYQNPNKKISHITEATNESFDSIVDSWVEKKGVFNEQDGLQLLNFFIAKSQLNRFEKVLTCTKANSLDLLYEFAHSCIARNSIEILEFLFKSGVDVNNPSIILRVLFSSKMKLIRFCQAQGMDITSHANLGLCFAIYTENEKYVNELIDFYINLGADVNCHNSLPMALTVSNLSCIPKLISLGADINSRNGFLLRAAVEEYNEDTLKLLLDNGADVSHLSSGDLIKCVNSGSSSMLKKLMDLGADFNVIEIENSRDRDNSERETKIDLLSRQGLDMSKIARIFSYNGMGTYQSEEDYSEEED